MQPIRVIVTGGRLYGEQYDPKTGRERPLAREELAHLEDTLEELALMYGRPLLIVQGGATGADRRAREWATAKYYTLGWPKPVTFEANWERYRRHAGPIRNGVMVAAGADLVVAFPGGSGTADCVRQAREARLYVLDLREEGPKLAA